MCTRIRNAYVQANHPNKKHGPLVLKHRLGHWPGIRYTDIMQQGKYTTASVVVQLTRTLPFVGELCRVPGDDDRRRVIGEPRRQAAFLYTGGNLVQEK